MYICLHTHTGIFSYKNEILQFAKIWVELVGIMLSETSQGKTYMTPLICEI